MLIYLYIAIYLLLITFTLIDLKKSNKLNTHWIIIVLVFPIFGSFLYFFLKNKR